MPDAGMGSAVWWLRLTVLLGCLLGSSAPTQAGAGAWAEGRVAALVHEAEPLLKRWGYPAIFGADADTAYLVHISSGKPIVCEGVDTIVIAHGHASDTRLEQALAGIGIPVHLAGDCLSPRTAEEAIYEGLMAGRAV